MRKVLALVLLAACGDDEFNALPDGPPPPDGMPDGPTSGLVKLTITESGLPQMGVKVYFQDSNNAEVSATMTDVNGVASAVMEAGGFVTASDPFLQRLPTGVATAELKTFAGVKPLDELVLSRNTPQDNTTINVNLLLNPDVNVGVGSYTLFSPCFQNGLDVTNGAGSGSGSGSVGGPVQFLGCGATTDLTIVVSDGTGLRTSIHKANVALVEGQDVDLTDLTYAAVEDVSWQYTNVPAEIGSFSVIDGLATTHGLQFVSFDGAIVDAGTGITAQRKRPVIAGNVQVVLSDFSGAPNSSHSLFDWGPATAAYTKSLTGVLLSSYATLPAYDLTTKSVTWTAEAGGATPDFAVVDTALLRGTPNPLVWDWQIVSPPGTELIRYPVLPAPDDQFNPTIGDSADVNQLTTAKVPGGYDALRETALSISGDSSGGLPLQLISGATGSLVFEDLQLPRGKRTPHVPFAEQVKRALKARRR